MLLKSTLSVFFFAAIIGEAFAGSHNEILNRHRRWSVGRRDDAPACNRRASNNSTTAPSAALAGSEASSSAPVPTQSTAAATQNLAVAVDLASPSTSGSLSGLKYTSVGGSGSYQQVISMPPGEFPSCNANPSCVKQTKSISGNLAPFNDDQSIVFEGPMDIHNIAVFQPPQPDDTSAWSQVSSWKPNAAPKNLVFMNNMGGGASGTWSVCQGASQSFANGSFTGTVASQNEQLYSGSIPATMEVNIMTAETCTSSTCDGFFRGAANKGWSDSKLFVIEFSTPPADGSNNTPAIWALPGQVMRSAQFGCNCRGMGGQGGCGELDIFEVLQAGNHNQGISEIYSFKGATGSGNNNFFARPTSGSVIYTVLFDVATDQIAISRSNSFNWDTQSLPRSTIDAYLNAPAMTIPFSG